MTVAHDSGGPKADIIAPTLREDPAKGLGFLAKDEASYAAALEEALGMFKGGPRGGGGEALAALQERTCASCARFSDQAFADRLTAVLVGDIDVRHRCIVGFGF